MSLAKNEHTCLCFYGIFLHSFLALIKITFKKVKYLKNEKRKSLNVL